MLEKSNEIWYKVMNSLKISFDSESLYNENNIKSQIKFYGIKIKAS